MSKGLYHHVGSWIVYVPLMGNYVELIEWCTDPIVGKLWARRRNRALWSN